MKIEIWYEPVYMETNVCINGQWQEDRDIYSFLYSVHQYPLQTWLNSSGTWPGLIQQLSDLSRGEEIECIFYGRKSDFNDLRTVMEGMELLNLTYFLWDSYAICEKKIGLIFEKFQELKQEIGTDDVLEELMGLLLKSEADEIDETEWVITIHNNREFKLAEKDNQICCKLSNEFMDSYERLGQIERLTRSFRRPMDAICCCFEDIYKRDTFARYAAQFPKFQYRFCLADDAGCREELWIKYGEASMKKKKLDLCIRICNQIKILLEQKKKSNDTRIMDLNNKKMKGEFIESVQTDLDQRLKKSVKLRELMNSWEKLEEKIVIHPSQELKAQRICYE